MVYAGSNKKLAGKLAQSAGKNFEAAFAFMSNRNGMACTRVPDGCRVVGPKRLVRVKSPFDWILTAKHGNQPMTVLLDTKTTKEETLSSSKINRDQVEELHKHAVNGVVTGYVVNFRSLNVVCFFPTLTLMACKRGTSIPPENGTYLGSSLAFDVRKIFSPTHHAADTHFPGRSS